jgi:hypothetical protein
MNELVGTKLTTRPIYFTSIGPPSRGVTVGTGQDVSEGKARIIVKEHLFPPPDTYQRPGPAICLQPLVKGLPTRKKSWT